MKTKSILLIGILSILLSSCLVKSLHPFYTENDVVFKPELTGTFLDADSATWIIKKYIYSKGFMKGDTTDNSYVVEMYEDTAHVSKFNVHLFELDGVSYLDFAPIREDREEVMLELHLIPTHSLARLDLISDDEMVVSWFDEDWLEKLFEENRVKIAHEVIHTTDQLNSTEYVLTASTEELQKFIIKYGNTELTKPCTENSNAICAKLKRVR